MNRYLTILLLIAGICACSSSKHESDTHPAPERNSAAAYMAYRHSMTVNVEEDKVLSIYQSALVACTAAIEAQCVMLEAQIDSLPFASADLKFRARSGGIKKVIAVLAEQGSVVSQETSAEDLAAPIADSTRQLKMQEDYRAKLERLLTRADSDVSSLITLSKELAQVQANIEALSGEKAHLTQRVETEILNVKIRSKQSESFWNPIGQSLQSFGKNLSEAISNVITATAYLLPWAIMLMALIWGIRRLWSRRKKQNTPT